MNYRYIRLTPKKGMALSLCSSLSFLATSFLVAQDDQEEDIFELSPFTVDGTEDSGYRASSTLAGSRLRTDLKDVGSAISVVTKELLEDLGAVDNETLLSYTTNTEVGGTESLYAGASGGNGTAINERSNFTNPNSNTRVRGLARADNTRNFFLTDVPWDNYVVDRIDMQRGPNSILFGMGSPAGIVNATTHDATFRNDNKAEYRIGSYGSMRLMFRGNRVLLEDELAVKFALMSDRQKFRQDPAFDDDERFYLATKYAPRFLKSESSEMTIKANFERGKVRSNRPRTLTPQDNITPFFNPIYDSSGTGYSAAGGLDGRVFNPFDVRNRNLYDQQVSLNGSAELPTRGNGFAQTQPTILIDGVETVNPDFIPILGGVPGGVGPSWVWSDPNSSEVSDVATWGVNTRGGIGTDGMVDQSLAYQYGAYATIWNYDDYAIAAGLPAADLGQYKRRHIQDRSLFDFYNKLIDGPNKSEWSDWDVFNASVSHTFLNGNLGYELSYFSQDYSSGRTGILGWNDSIYVDINSHLIDGSPNPNAGRPYVGDVMIGANNLSVRNRDSARATGFFKHDFQEKSDNWMARILGSHIFTGMASEAGSYVDSRTFHRYRLDDSWIDYQTKGGGPAVLDYQNAHNILKTIHYIGPSLIGESSASGLNLSNLGAVQLPSTAPIYTFNSEWNAFSVDPADPWIDPRTGGNSTQSENPDNYVGWSYQEPILTDSLNDPVAMANNTQGGNLSDSQVKSEALIWQGYFWNGAIAATYGWRKDTLENRNHSAPLAYKLADVSPEVYDINLADTIVEGGQTNTYSVAVHADELLGSPDWLPFNLSLYYNESENFQGGAGRNDMFGQPISAPTGNTRDKSILLSTKDGKYSLKVTDYKTTVNDATSAYLQNTWIMGNVLALGETWANVHSYNIAEGETLDGVREDNPTYRQWRFRMKNPDGVFDQAYEDLAVADWRAYRDAVITTFPTFAEAWSLQGLGSEVKRFVQRNPTGLAYTEDATSVGTEFEFTATPTKNFRLTMNASKTEAFRNNVGGRQVIEFVELTDWWFANSEAGNIRLYGGGGANTTAKQWNKFRAKYSLTKLLEGTASPELRKWRFNAVGNYRFSEGRLKGFSVGGGLRWADDVVLGYNLAEDENGNAVYDLNSPHVGPTDTKVDLTLAYRKKLENGMNWRVQLNVRDLFAEKELIPISTQPDGSYAAVRIPGSTTWQLTNVFEF